MNKILQMLKLQQQLNDATNGKGWESGVTKNGKPINWKRCSYLECAELIESYPWKHWKNIDAKPDYENIKIEVVDIWHFIMSQALTDYKVGGLGNIETLAKDITNLQNFEDFKVKYISIKKDYYVQIEAIELLIHALFCGESIEKLIMQFFNISIQSGLNLDNLYKLYIGKNILNQFRQDHGYKEGSYIKIWNNEEDNVTMQRILDNEPEITPEALYEKLEETYPV
ncbi:MAG: dUTP diphosphatase [Sulfurovum sp.]|nr:dUTP diphosphatase [Sulfurovum sp.]MCB4765300.1 dUTP diphosphatase [Sulfurovum sp.]MCB4765748.1 dUTP diphosphatase [Sulfurovum sp.]MCB4772627.1 dUTP diphosphatase [Sulfurovum sp.]MCB4778131.1 dUTP diphosphatase [Sulfurovum sp.]